MNNAPSKTNYVFLHALCLLLIIGLSAAEPAPAKWTTVQLDKANTAKDVASLTAEEKEVIQYINLARLYPQLFVKIELKNYNGPAGCNSNMYLNAPEKASLIKELEAMKAMSALKVEEVINDKARCFAKEIGAAGRIDHKRVNCPPIPGGECISFGLSDGREVALDLLIDQGVASEIHREICLTSGFSRVGLSMQPHTKWKVCTVIDFSQ